MDHLPPRTGLRRAGLKERIVLPNLKPEQEAKPMSLVILDIEMPSKRKVLIMTQFR